MNEIFCENNNSVFCENEILNKKKLREFNEFLVEYNKNVNLTAHKTAEDSFLFNIQDSVLFMREMALYIGCENGARVSFVDIGSGCGCPAIPLAVCFPKTRWTLVDSIGKKVDFLNLAIQKFGIKNAVAIKSRVEDLACSQSEKSDAQKNCTNKNNSCKKNFVTDINDNKGGAQKIVLGETNNINNKKFDFLTARAVASLPTLLEYALPLLKVGGIAFLYKGSNADEEILQAKRALSVLGGEVVAVLHKNLTPEIERTLVVVRKVRQTPPCYPRGANKPRLAPIL